MPPINVRLTDPQLNLQQSLSGKSVADLLPGGKLQIDPTALEQPLKLLPGPLAGRWGDPSQPNSDWVQAAIIILGPASVDANYIAPQPTGNINLILTGHPWQHRYVFSFEWIPLEGLAASDTQFTLQVVETGGSIQPPLPDKQHAPFTHSFAWDGALWGPVSQNTPCTCLFQAHGTCKGNMTSIQLQRL